MTFKKSVAVAVVGVVCAAPALADSFNIMDSYYVGAGYSYGSTEGNSDYKDVVPDDFHYYNIFAGTKFHENFGFELGFRQSTESEVSKSFSTTDTFFGNTFGAAVTSTLKVKKRVFDFDLNGFYPMQDNFELVGTVGVGFAKLSFDSTTSASVAGLGDDRIRQTDSASGVTLHVAGGFNYEFSPAWKLRARVTWESNSSLKAKDSGVEEKIYKSEPGFSLGVQYTFA